MLNEKLRASREPLPEELGLSKLTAWRPEKFGSGPIEYWEAFRRAAVKLKLRRTRRSIPSGRSPCSKTGGQAVIVNQDRAAVAVPETPAYGGTDPTGAGAGTACQIPQRSRARLLRASGFDPRHGRRSSAPARGFSLVISATRPIPSPGLCLPPAEPGWVFVAVGADLLVQRGSPLLTNLAILSSIRQNGAVPGRHGCHTPGSR